MGEVHILYSFLSTLWLDEGSCTRKKRTYQYADSFHCK